MGGRGRNRAFTLVELLVVVGIIGLLIGILLPSLSGARKSAKNGKIKLQFNSLSQALQMFNNDIGEFPDSAKRIDPTDDSSGTVTGGNDGDINGAQMLVRALWGKDFRGYVSPSAARKHNRAADATEWYDNNDVSPATTSDFPRSGPYMVEKLSVVKTRDIVGGVKPPEVVADLDKYNNHVALDAYERPVLYYRANPRGTAGTKVLCSDEEDGNGYSVYDPNQIPYYNLIDNVLFTGHQEAGAAQPHENGWKFTSSFHPLRWLGDVNQPDDVSDNVDPVYNDMTFSKYIHDHQVGLVAGEFNPTLMHNKAQPVNAATYLLISAGPDGLYGTGDDIKNFGQP